MSPSDTDVSFDASTRATALPRITTPVWGAPA